MPLADNIGFLLSRASGHVVRRTNAALAGEGLRVRQHSVLSLVCEAAGGASQRRLAEALGLDPSQVVALVDELDAAGLVERRPAPADRRTKLVVATDLGHRVNERAEQRADGALREALAELSDAERETLRDLLARLVAAA